MPGPRSPPAHRTLYCTVPYCTVLYRTTVPRRTKELLKRGWGDEESGSGPLNPHYDPEVGCWLSVVMYRSVAAADVGVELPVTRQAAVPNALPDAAWQEEEEEEGLPP